jgi:hypothetical protein
MWEWRDGKNARLGRVQCGLEELVGNGSIHTLAVLDFR